jgi:multicomponent Na+:H+ antiporter subunit A
MATGELSLTLLAIFLPFVAAAIAPFLTRSMGHNAAWVLAAAPALLFLHWLGFLGPVSSGQAMTGGVSWIPSLGVDISWYVDGLSLTFAL